MNEVASDDMLNEAIEAYLLPSLEWDNTEWIVCFNEQDKAHGWCGMDKNMKRAIKKAYCQWKQIYFDNEVD